MELDQNTTQFITAQAAKAKSKSVTMSRGPSATREMAITDVSTLVTGNISQVQEGRVNMTGGRPELAPTRDNAANVGLRHNVGEQRGMAALAQANLKVHTPDEDVSDDDSVSTIKRKCKKRSGMVASPADYIKTPQIWPHYNLAYGFVTTSIQFHQLSFEQFVAGETKTIQNASDPLEITGRLNLMSRLG